MDKKTKLTKQEACELVTKMEESKIKGKQFYKDSDECAEKLLGHFGLGEHKLADGRTLIVKDAFFDKLGKPSLKKLGFAMVPKVEFEVRLAA